MELVGDGTDNPEQRIEQDCAAFAEQTLDISIDLLSQVMTLVTFTAILWGLSGSIVVPIFGGITIPGYMFWAALLYSVFGSWLTYRIGRPLIGINFNLQRYNADFRYRMTRVRENAEQIALYRGEADEKRGLSGSFARIYTTWWLYMKYNKRLNWLTSFYGQVASIFPIIVASPRYFAGIVPLGVLTQTAGAFAQVQGSLSWFVDAYPTVANWMAVVDRLTSFGAAMERAKEAGAAEAGIKRAPGPSDALAVNGVEVRLPSGALLIDRSSFEVRPGETVSLSGPSGSGKTTLFRVLAGLWPYGDGEIDTPKDWHVLFLPQRPYLPIGSLRQTLCYPEPPTKFDDEACREALEDCQLGHLVEHLEETANWSLALSVGEQQRLAFARALLAEARLDLHRRRHLGARPADGGAPLRASQGAPQGNRHHQHYAPRARWSPSTIGISTSTRRRMRSGRHRAGAAAAGLSRGPRNRPEWRGLGSMPGGIGQPQWTGSCGFAPSASSFACFSCSRLRWRARIRMSGSMPRRRWSSTTRGGSPRSAITGSSTRSFPPTRCRVSTRIATANISPEELKPLAKENVESLKDFDYFTFLSVGDYQAGFAAPKDYHLELAGGPAAAALHAAACDSASRRAAPCISRSTIRNIMSPSRCRTTRGRQARQRAGRLHARGPSGQRAGRVAAARNSPRSARIVRALPPGMQSLTAGIENSADANCGGAAPAPATPGAAVSQMAGRAAT